MTSGWGICSWKRKTSRTIILCFVIIYCCLLMMCEREGRRCIEWNLIFNFNSIGLIGWLASCFKQTKPNTQPQPTTQTHTIYIQTTITFFFILPPQPHPHHETKVIWTTFLSLGPFRPPRQPPNQSNWIKI